MKEINIRFKTQDEFYKDSHSLPFVITIDGELQNNVKRFAIDLDNIKNYNLDDYAYLIEKYITVE
jgi:hypothetical protein